MILFASCLNHCCFETFTYPFSHFFFMTLPSQTTALCYFADGTALVDSQDFLSALILFGSRSNCEYLLPLFIDLANSLILSAETDFNPLFTPSIIIMWYCFEFYTKYCIVRIIDIAENLEIGLFEFVFLLFLHSHFLA